MKLKIFLIFSLYLFSQDFFENHPGILLSGKYIKQDEAYAGLFGFNYEYRFEESYPVTGFGLNSTVEIGEQIEFNSGPALYYHPTQNMVLSIAPLYSFTRFPDAPSQSGLSPQEIQVKTGPQHNFVLRFMAYYNFPFQVVDVSPILGIDIVSENYEAFLGVNITLPIDFKIRI
jgi:hypothetical protein